MSAPSISPAIEIAPVPDRDAWRALLVQTGPTALEQGWGYGEAHRRHHGQAVERLSFTIDGAPRAVVQAFRRRVLGVGRLSRIVRGPVWIGEPDSDARRAVLRAISARYKAGWRQVLLWMPELTDGAGARAAMRGAGLRRVVTGYSSVWLDLAPDEAALRAGLDGNWRNALGAAERAGVTVALCRERKAIDRQIVACDAFRRAHRFIGPSGALIRELIEAAGLNDAALVLAASEGGRDIAGIVLLRHGAAATYHAGWTSNEGRRLNAHNLLLWRGVLALRKAGAGWLDLGGVGAAAPGVARFKLGMGGAFFTLSGTWI